MKILLSISEKGKSYERTGWRYLVLEKFSTLNKNAEQKSLNVDIHIILRNKNTKHQLTLF